MYSVIISHLGNLLNDISCKYIGESLNSNKTLKLLDISFNRIYQEGCEFLFELLTHNVYLETVKISGTLLNL
jgi:Ran GTPase-activating protein (RanGAP) involved in mRNA processing and transport